MYIVYTGNSTIVNQGDTASRTEVTRYPCSIVCRQAPLLQDLCQRHHGGRMHCPKGLLWTMTEAEMYQVSMCLHGPCDSTGNHWHVLCQIHAILTGDGFLESCRWLWWQCLQNNHGMFAMREYAFAIHHVMWGSGTWSRVITLSMAQHGNCASNMGDRFAVQIQLQVEFVGRIFVLIEVWKELPCCEGHQKTPKHVWTDE